MMFVIQIRQQYFELKENELYCIAWVSHKYPFEFIFKFVIGIVFVFVSKFCKILYKKSKV